MARSRLTPERESELYETVIDLLGEVGYDGLTMDAIAARTRSSKATLYRQWGSKPQLVAQSLRHHRPVELAEIDTGSLRGDLHEMVGRSDDCRLAKDSAMVRGLAHAVGGNPELHRALRELLVEPEVTGLDRILRRAVERGEVAAGNPALDLVPHLMIAVFVSRSLIEERPVDQAYLATYVDAVVLPALGAP
ncbi:TetR/AcrR family transcriptional regulator [Streptomyces somaliensis]|uniref:TetR/AcrR family transcriptional regulator n=1 Tax=Streptomyces somaliensis (strain ATCC 33201 / DSM 40738 / JCM 12659 / KCTC 9044 / NCTC 11332 / NRRL B-12077 / IP 733) TaxID=1134445 RepID=A0AA44DC42_STRE0|nr:TetR/AcrR family transcriptional regulator [Streptomyces somaliensis]MCP9944117.1 TetR/AcrR family transcriptional regulator [Streptomyces somaliensis]MCP9962649.1 TetR/AcrR family transcriptional regulator [Streptomyces somaliensis]MCP9975479.1 TetR/AcrR family transcriptional regulator [Streptomyces somaliensis]MCQ0023093.1 TetR/AcrR family transcriptional regulator [Streptomyces somaliensis DSM 40738]NKY13650.1 TetR/AcrR family transcriptional regulator [Streptomyces somaliensis DSM 4073